MDHIAAAGFIVAFSSSLVQGILNMFGILFQALYYFPLFKLI